MAHKDHARDALRIRKFSVDDFVSHQKPRAMFQFFLHLDFHNAKNLLWGRCMLHMIKSEISKAFLPKDIDPLL
jgi:hypothetical protein